MSTFAVDSSRADRIGRPTLSAYTRGAGDGLRRKPRGRAALEVAGTAGILLLIMLASLALRWLLSLPHGVFH